MQERPGKGSTDRDLRNLSTKELLDLLKEDVRELDRAWRQRPHPAVEERPPAPPSRGRRSGKSCTEPASTGPDLFEPIELLSAYHAVSCCNVRMGDFPSVARVRCPFCGAWHKAGDFPVTNLPEI